MRQKNESNVKGQAGVLACWGCVILALILGTYWGLPALVRYYTGGELFPTDTMMTLFVAVYTLEATLLIAVLIYSLQTRTAKWSASQRAKSARRIVCAELEFGLQSVICAPRSGGSGGISSRFSELLLAYLPDIQDTLEDSQLHLLIKIVDVLSNIAKLSTDGSEHASEYVQSQLLLMAAPQFYPAMISPFAYRFEDVADYRDVLNPMVRGLIEKLSGETLPASDSRVLYDKHRKKLLELTERDTIRFYDVDGALLCDAVFDSLSADMRGVESGWVKLEQYEGEYQNGLRHGQGCSYSMIYHHKLFEGTWERGDPVRGTEYDVIVEKDINTEDGYREWFPYWKDFTMVESHLIDVLYQEDGGSFDLERLYVCDLVGEINGESRESRNVRPFIEFIRKEDPNRLDRILKYMDDYKREYPDE